MKVFRILAFTLLGVVALLVAAVVVATLVVDPNSYKPQIERVVERSTRLDLNLAGNIDWSLFPLGLSLADVNAELDGELFARLDTLVAEVDFWSLLRLEPEVNTFILEGMTANLIRNAQGVGNWERITREAATPEPTQAPESASTTAQQKPLQFQIEKVLITDADLNYTDEASGQELVVDQVDLTAENISLGSTFPMELSFHVTTAQPALDVEGNLNASITAAEDLQRFTLAGLDSSFEIQGEPFAEETVNASLAGDFVVDLNQETANLAGFRAELENLVMLAELDVKGFGDNAELSGSLAVEPFSARELIAQLGLPALDTQDPAALEEVALKATIGGPAGHVVLNDFVLRVDETQFQGQLQYGLANGRIDVGLEGNRLNLDRYLPAASEPDPAAAEATAENGEESGVKNGAESGAPNGSTAGAAPDADLLPLDTLRGLLFDVSLTLNELIVKNLQINAIEVQATGENGLLTIDPIKGKMYEGDFLVTAELDARQDNPRWKISQRLNNIQTLPLLTDLAELKLLSGKVQMRADITTRGNRVEALRQNADGDASFTIDDGAFETVNLTAYACEGIALVNGESIDTGDWPQRTEFKDMSGVMQIDGNILNNTDLSAALGGLDLAGEGTIDLAEMLLDYELGLKVVGAIHKAEACRVNERIQNLAIPVECRGSLEDPASLCSFDGSRFRETVKDLAEAELRRKAAKEVDEALEKQLDDALGEDGENSEARKQIKDAIKGLFN